MLCVVQEYFKHGKCQSVLKRLWQDSLLFPQLSEGGRLRQETPVFKMVFAGKIFLNTFAGQTVTEKSNVC